MRATGGVRPIDRYSIEVFVPAMTAQLFHSDTPARHRRWATLPLGALCVLLAMAASAPAPALAQGSAQSSHTTWFLAEGATGDFDSDILIGNPHDEPVPIRITWVLPAGSPQVAPTEFTMAPTSRTTVHVNAIPGLDTTAVSAIVESLGTPARAVVVERSMYWRDLGQVKGHNSPGVTAPATTWFLAEGATGDFNTFVLIANPDASQTADVAVTFFQQDGVGATTPMLRAVTPGQRAGVFVNVDVPSLANASFSTRVDSTNGVPIIVERAMYAPATSGRFPGPVGHGSHGLTTPSTRWIFAEGVTGGVAPHPVFDTFLLLANPGPVAADVRVYYRNADGLRYEQALTVERGARRTVWVNLDVPGFEATAFSMDVVSNVPILAERTVYWGDGTPATWREAHNSPGATSEALAWAFAEGLDGTFGLEATPFQSYFLIANTSLTDDLQVRLTFFREDGVAIVRDDTCPRETRCTVASWMVPELHGHRFATLIESTNALPFVAERAVYWGAGFAGGHASLGTPWAGLVSPPAGALVVTSLIADVSQHVVGQAATWTATTSGGTAPVSFQFWLWNGCTGAWSLLQDYGPSPSATWTPTAACVYDLQVWARSAGSTAPWEAGTSAGAFSVDDDPWWQSGIVPATFDEPVRSSSSMFPSVGDLTGDGWLDLLTMPNDGTGALFEVSLASLGLDDYAPSIEVWANRDTRIADFTGDGLPDLVTNVYAPHDGPFRARLYVNQGDGTFAADPAFDALDIRGFGETVVVADFDNDGDLDIFIPHYTHNHPDEQNYLLINDGTGRFHDIADAAGVAMRGWPGDLKVEGAQAVDFDRDGFIDLFVGNHFFFNNGDLTFTDRRAALGLPLRFDEGLKFLDWNNDGHLDLLLHNPWEGPLLYEYDGEQFHLADVIRPRPYASSFGMNVYDLNNDGLEDFIVAGGNTRDTVVFMNMGERFVENPTSAISSWGNDAIAFGDFNRDGRIDVAKRDGQLVYAINTTPVDGYWLEVEIVDDLGRPNQHGRVVSITPLDAPDVVMTRVVDGGSGFLSQNQYSLLVGTRSPGAHTVVVWFDTGPRSFVVNALERVRLFRDGRSEPIPAPGT